MKQKISLYDARNQWKYALNDLQQAAWNLHSNIDSQTIPFRSVNLQDAIAEERTRFDIYYNVWKEEVSKHLEAQKR